MSTIDGKEFEIRNLRRTQPVGNIVEKLIGLDKPHYQGVGLDISDLSLDCYCKENSSVDAIREEFIDSGNIKSLEMKLQDNTTAIFYILPRSFDYAQEGGKESGKFFDLECSLIDPFHYKDWNNATAVLNSSAGSIGTFTHNGNRDSFLDYELNILNENLCEVSASSNALQINFGRKNLVYDGTELNFYNAFFSEAFGDSFTQVSNIPVTNSGGNATYRKKDSINTGKWDGEYNNYFWKIGTYYKGIALQVRKSLPFDLNWGCQKINIEAEIWYGNKYENGDTWFPDGSFSAHSLYIWNHSSSEWDLLGGLPSGATFSSEWKDDYNISNEVRFLIHGWDTKFYQRGEWGSGYKTETFVDYFKVWFSGKENKIAAMFPVNGNIISNVDVNISNVSSQNASNLIIKLREANIASNNSYLISMDNYIQKETITIENISTSQTVYVHEQIPQNSSYLGITFELEPPQNNPDISLIVEDNSNLAIATFTEGHKYSKQFNCTTGKGITVRSYDTTTKVKIYPSTRSDKYSSTEDDWLIGKFKYQNISGYDYYYEFENIGSLIAQKDGDITISNGSFTMSGNNAILGYHLKTSAPMKSSPKLILVSSKSIDLDISKDNQTYYSVTRGELVGTYDLYSENCVLEGEDEFFLRFSNNYAGSNDITSLELRCPLRQLYTPLPEVASGGSGTAMNYEMEGYIANVTANFSWRGTYI